MTVRSWPEAAVQTNPTFLCHVNPQAFLYAGYRILVENKLVSLDRTLLI